MSLEGIRRVSGGYRESIWRVSRRCLKGSGRVWKMSGGVPKFFWTTNNFLPKFFASIFYDSQLFCPFSARNFFGTHIMIFLSKLT